MVNIKSQKVRGQKSYTIPYKIYLTKEKDWILKSLKNSNSLLDVGCGDGRLTKLLKSKTKNYVGIDIDSRAIFYAQKNFKNATFFIMSIESAKKFQDNQFDTAVCLWSTIGNIFHYKKAIREIYRITKKEVFISTVQKNHIKERKEYYDALNINAKINSKSEVIKSKEWGIARAFTKEELVKICKLVGFSICKIVQLGDIGFGLELKK